MRLQQGVEALEEATYESVCHNSIWKALDDVTNVELNVDGVKAARDLEMQSFERVRAHDRVSRSEIKRTGGQLMGARWVDVDKGGSINVDCRSRLVGQA